MEFPKLKIEDVDEVAEEVLAEDEEVSDETASNEELIKLESTHGALPTASSIAAADEYRKILVNTSEDASLKNTGVTISEKEGIETSSKNEDHKATKSSLDTGKPRYKDTVVLQKSRTAEVVDTDEYIIITLSASRRKELPKTKKSSRTLFSGGSESNAPKIKASSMVSMPYKSSSVVTEPKRSSPGHSKLAFQASSEIIEESSKLETSEIPSKSSKVSEDCTSGDASMSMEAPNVASKTSEVYKAKTPFVLHEASDATTQFPDAEFYDEFRNHTIPTKWNNPVHRNMYQVYKDFYAPVHVEPYTKRSRNTAKIPKKFSTFLLRVLKKKKVSSELENVALETEILPTETSDPSIAYVADPPSTFTRTTTSASFATNTNATRYLFRSSTFTSEINPIEQLSAFIDATNPLNPLSTFSGATELFDPISYNTSDNLEKPKSRPSTSKPRHTHSTSTFAADPFDPLSTSTVGINPLKTHSTSSTDPESPDPLSVNPIKFREKLRKLSRSESIVESPLVQSKGTDLIYKTGAVPKIRAEPRREAESSAISKSGSIPSAVLSKDEEIIIETVPQTGLLLETKAVSKGVDVPEERSIKKGEIPKDVAIPKKGAIPSGVVPKGGDVPRVEAIPEGGAIPKYGAVSKGGAIPTDGRISRGGVVPKNGAIPKGGSLAESGAVPKGGAVPKSDSMSKSGYLAKTGTIPKQETLLTRTVAVLPQDGSKSTTSSKTKSEAHLKKGQYRDIPVIAYVRRVKRYPPKTNLEYYLPKEDIWIRGYWRKFKYYKRIESERQQKLLEKIIYSLHRVDQSMRSAYNYSRSVEKLRHVTCDMEESLKYRNSNMKWIMSRLMHKTEIISDFLETIRCDVVLYTLETSASNNITSKRLYKLLKFICGKQERKKSTEGKLTPVEEEVEIIPQYSWIKPGSLSGSKHS